MPDASDEELIYEKQMARPDATPEQAKIARKVVEELDRKRVQKPAEEFRQEVRQKKRLEQWAEVQRGKEDAVLTTTSSDTKTS